MQKLYVAMVGLPASGKSTLAGRIREALLGEGINAEIFNNGELRRKLAGPRSTEASFYSPQNEEGREMRQKIALANMWPSWMQPTQAADADASFRPR